MKYNIILKDFQGPLDLLLHLIDESKIDIYDIPINKITEQYIEYIDKMKEVDLEVTSEFLLMAASLLEIKSKLLLPVEAKFGDRQSEDDNIDPRTELVKRLLEYKKYKLASEKLKKYELEQSKIYYKPKEDFSDYKRVEEELKQMDLNSLIAVFNNLIKNKKDRIDPITIGEIQREEYTLTKSTEKIRNLLYKNKRIELDLLLESELNRQEVITIFLSLLELAKNKEIIIVQQGNFSKIMVYKVV